MAFKISESKTILKKFFNINSKILTKNDGTTHEYCYVVHPEAVMVVCYDEKSNSVYMVEQVRIPFEQKTIEFVAGVIDEGETPRDAAIREVNEEIGKNPNKIEYLGKFNPFMGSMKTAIHMFVATELISSKQNLDPFEEIDVKQYDLDELSKIFRYSKDNTDVPSGFTEICSVMAYYRFMDYLDEKKENTE